MKRIHELAKEQGIDSNDIIAVLTRAGLPASKCTPSSTISPEWERRLLPLCEKLREAAERQAERSKKVATKRKSTRTRAASASGTGASARKSGARKSSKTKPTRAAKTKRSTRTTKATKATTKTTTKTTKTTKATKAKKTTKRAASAKKATRKAQTAKRAPRKPAAKRYTEDTVEVVRQAPSELDAWVGTEELQEVRKKRVKAHKATAQPSEGERLQARALTPEEIIAGAGLLPKQQEAARKAAKAKEEAQVEAEAAAPDVVEAKPEAAEAEAVQAAEVGDAVAAKPAETKPAEAKRAEAKPAKAKKAKGKRPAEVEAEVEAKAEAKAEAAAEAPAVEAGQAEAPEAQVEEEPEPAKAKAKKRRARQPRRTASLDAEEEGVGVGLLGDIGQEDDDTLVAKVGAVPDAPMGKTTIPIGGRRTGGKKKDEVAKAGAGFQPGRGFVQGRGFSQSGQQVPAQTGGRRGKRQFFNLGGSRRRGRHQQRHSFERPKSVTLSPPITVKDLSAAIGVRVPDIIRSCMKMGKMIRQNDALNEDEVLEIGLQFNVEVEIARKREAEDELAEMFDQKPDDPKDLKSRAPVITILGHVDHGKTTLLDKIRETNVASGEAGGITQKISAFRVPLDKGRSVVFVDTPGHAAFTEMRARGANVTDVVVLVVAADDGVMPQTEEAYNHAKAAEAPIIVAVNKVDKANANVAKVRQQLAGMGLQPVDWGGDTEVLEVSALKGEGIQELLETLSLQAEILELKANPRRAATGTCLEARKTRGRGVVANLLVQNGTLKRGDVIVCGTGYGRVRAIFNDRGKKVDKARPSTPVEVIGLETLPEASARFYVLDDLTKAKEIAEKRMQRVRLEQLAERSAAGHVSLETLFDRMQQGLTKEIRIVLKADSRGSIEVLQKELPALSTEEVRVRVLHGAVGGITESDVLLADASDAIVIGFNVIADDKARSAAELKGVDIRTYRVIYQITEELKAAMEQQLEPEEREVVTATIEVRKTFKASAIGTIAGCYVQKGTVERSNRIRLTRDGIIKYEGQIASLKRHKDDVKEVREGFECGIVLDDYQDVHEGDLLEAYRIDKIARKLAPA